MTDLLRRITSFRILILLFGLELVLAPFIYNHILLYGNSFIIDQIFVVNLERYFLNFFQHGKIFFEGVYSQQQVVYIPWYFILTSITYFSTELTAHFIFLYFVYTCSYLSFVAFLRSFVPTDRDNDDYIYTSICLISVLFFSSPAMFTYVKYEMASFLSYPLLIIAINSARQYILTGRKKYAFYILIVSLFSLPINVTYQLIGIGFVNYLLFLHWWAGYFETAKAYLYKTLIINFLLVLPLVIIAVLTLSKLFGEAGFAANTSILNETFYSNNTNYVNIFLQRTDWAFFGGWRGVPYYVFSAFYSNPLISLIGFIAPVLFFSLFSNHVLILGE